MSAYPFEVVPVGRRFTWRIIGGCGRTLVSPGRTYRTDREAADAARTYRAEIAAHAERVDGRHG